MRIKVLLIASDPISCNADVQLLRDKNMLVYTLFDTCNISDMIDEVNPDAIFISSSLSGAFTDVYNAVLDNEEFMNIPVIYTLDEDALYLVNRRRTHLKERSNLVADNLLSAIKTVLFNTNTYLNKPRHSKVKLLYDMYNSYGARA